jgi:hypothetical protein
MEVICIGAAAAFVLATWGLIALCDRLQGEGR